uniref:Uncharacterized protein n=1 Tax=Arundo donax TaxID=35708 RepID=A0A0A8ZEM2_ARUDO
MTQTNLTPKNECCSLTYSLLPIDHKQLELPLESDSPNHELSFSTKIEKQKDKNQYSP